VNANRKKMRDVLVILPGITGSVLEKRDGTKIWAPFSKTIVSYISSLGSSVELLSFKYDDPEYDDGIYATGLMPYTLVPRLARFDGYTGLTSLLKGRFTLTIGDANKEVGPPANYFEFPYDWRRDNRVSAQRLKKLIDRELPKWRKHTDNPGAKVILLCHSMGGLVGRYYTEVLQGYVGVRALITFGTPHRGSVDTIDSIVNGYRKFGIRLKDLTAATRTLTSVYQLLPRYKAILDTDGVWKRIFETNGRIHHIDLQRAKDAYAFYTEIETAYEKNRAANDYKVSLLPVMGWGHDTLQSAVVRRDGGVDVGWELPADVDEIYLDGDGTVPRVSAVPLELDDQPMRWRPVNQKHATLQNNEELLVNLVQTLEALQGQRLPPARARPGKKDFTNVGLHIEDMYAVDEPVYIRVVTRSSADPGAVTAIIKPRENTSNPKVTEVQLNYDVDTWKGEATGLSPGAYRITIHIQNTSAGPIDPVSDVFEVV
jgi:pimeloyl-ACP methyl ester carboxylesterase